MKNTETKKCSCTGLCLCHWKKAAQKLEVAVASLELLSKHSGYCDGPMGCGCKAPIAIAALQAIKEEKPAHDGLAFIEDVCPRCGQWQLCRCGEEKEK